MFTISADPARKLISARMGGFLSPGEVADFSRQEQQMVEDMGCGTGEFLLLVDTECAVLQSQAVVASFIDIVANSRYKARKIAVVRGSSLTRMQTQRILMIRENGAIFATLGDAQTWLFSPDDTEADLPVKSRG